MAGDVRGPRAAPHPRTCDLELLAGKLQALQVLVRLQHMRVQRQLVGCEQPGAVLARIVVVQALLDQVLLHEHRLPVRLSLHGRHPFGLSLPGAALGGGPGRSGRWVLRLQAAEGSRLSWAGRGGGGRGGWPRAPEEALDCGVGGRGREAAYLCPGDGGSCLRMGNRGSLSTPCSCFSLYSFCRSTSWCRSRSLERRLVVTCPPPGPCPDTLPWRGSRSPGEQHGAPAQAVSSGSGLWSTGAGGRLGPYRGLRLRGRGVRWGPGFSHEKNGIQVPDPAGSSTPRLGRTRVPRSHQAGLHRPQATSRGA